MRTSNAQHRTPNLEPREMERAMPAEYDLEERLLEYSVRINRLGERLPNTRAGHHVAGQLLRSGTSPLPNHGAAQAAESAEKAVATQASRLDVRCSALDVRSSFPACRGGDPHAPGFAQPCGREHDADLHARNGPTGIGGAQPAGFVGGRVSSFGIHRWGPNCISQTDCRSGRDTRESHGRVAGQSWETPGG
jgi:hypothetical protein